MKKIMMLGLFVLVLSVSASAQTSIRKATAPKATIVSVKNGQEAAVSSLKFGQENYLRITVSGGVQNIDHKIYVTSTNAVVKHVKNNEYIVTPVSGENVELIIDVETYEDYLFYQLKPKGKKKKMKKVLTTFPPEKYMVGYETFKVNKT